MLRDAQSALVKVSFLPDHVHLAVRVHPTVSPAELILKMLNDAQEFIWKEFQDLVICPGVERLWQPSAYLGSFGELASPQLGKYIANWESAAGRE